VHPASAPPPEFDVVVRQASLRYGGAFLIRDLEFVLPGGRWTCLLGPSGVGKSSLLRVIAGLASLESGEVVCTDGRPLAGRLAWMSQRDDLLPWLTVTDNVTLGARLRGEPPDRAQALELLARVGLIEQKDQLPATLSGGQRQRAALARTLMEHRPVVLMDEPFSALDAITRARLQVLAAGLLAGRTVLLVTHDPLEALRLGHRIQVMAGHPARIEGTIEPAGAPPRDLHDPALLARQGDLLARLADVRDDAA
jgi:putative hydroxymethylpyrimidine transport system ATP-binding protein